MLDTAAKIALAPVLAAQALWVRRHALILPEPPGPRTGETGSGPPLRLLIVGDSSAAGVGAPTQQAALAGQLVASLAEKYRVRWRLVARTGATTQGTLTRMAREPAEPFDVAVTALGVNDVTRLVALHRWLDHQARLRAQLGARFGVAHVLASGLPPMGAFPALPQPLRWVLGRTAQRFDTALARASAGVPGWRHIAFTVALTPDLMAEDGFHPGPAGYALWAQIMAAEIDAALSTQATKR